LGVKNRCNSIFLTRVLVNGCMQKHEGGGETDQGGEERGEEELRGDGLGMRRLLRPREAVVLVSEAPLAR
jgi:hypothetical protein